ncbi:MAG: autotransporter outer membrane beta-barrel domain-containing protein, partial [Planctomycetota bacterium]|jgi:outer membrane autotransporter protein|nr:autotransporter outer membrane beta-barrel domain-containing protein [Planctomycetota bacterium]
MKKLMLWLPLVVLGGIWPQSAPAEDGENYSNSPYAAQIGFDSFNYSVKQRLESIRLGVLDSGYSAAPLIRSDSAMAAPASRSSSVRSSYTQRQLDCVYTSGFTVWGDIYQTWASQRSEDDNAGYRYTATAPAVGFDWTSGSFTVGLATTYNWGRLRGKDISHNLKARAWDIAAYGQYNTNRYYARAGIGYGYNHYSGNRWAAIPQYASYHSHSLNLEGEFGLKFNFSDFMVNPHAGIRLFHDRRGAFAETPLTNISFGAGKENYYVLELPLGVDLGYAIKAGGALIVPRVKAAWIPELARRRGRVSGSLLDSLIPYSSDSPRRSRNGFLLGLGLEAKITKSLSGHIDYDVNFRHKAYEHHWNVGVGFTF